jgi:hypothetical protein
MVIPVGAIITAVRVRVFCDNTADGTAAVTLDRVNDTPASVGVASFTYQTSGWSTLSATVSETVASNVIYVATFTLTSTATDNPAALWVEIDYTAPNLFTSY